MAISGPQYLYCITYVTRRIQRYGGTYPNCETGDTFPSDCEGKCNQGSRCVPKSTYRTDQCIWSCSINPYGDWLSVPECSIQIKYFFYALVLVGGQETRHDVIWEANVDRYGRVNWTYACLDRCTPPAGTYELVNNENWLQSCTGGRTVHGPSDCPSTPKYYNFCTNVSCGCFACDSDRAQHFVKKNAW